VLEPAAHYVHAGRRTLPSWRGRSSYRQQIDNSTGIQYSAKLFARLFTSIVRLGSPNTVMLPHILMDAINMGIISTPSQLQPNVHACSSTQGSVVVIIDISGVHKNRCVFSPPFLVLSTTNTLLPLAIHWRENVDIRVVLLV
jgi:hypothetical protein